MKKIILLASLVLSAVFTPSSFAQGGDDVLVPLAALVTNASAKVGMTPAQVVAELGAPSEKLGDNVWAYWDFRATNRPARENNNALVVVFADGKVRVLRLTERSQVEAALAKVRATATKAPVIAKK